MNNELTGNNHNPYSEFSECFAETRWSSISQNYKEFCTFKWNSSLCNTGQVFFEDYTLLKGWPSLYQRKVNDVQNVSWCLF